jgi:hypothetical protein
MSMSVLYDSMTPFRSLSNCVRRQTRGGEAGLAHVLQSTTSHEVDVLRLPARRFHRLSG